MSTTRIEPANLATVIPMRTRRLASIPPVQGTLALDWRLPSGIPAAPVTAPDLHLVPRTCPDLTGGSDPDFEPVETSRADLPAPGPWIATLVQAVVEVLAGERPVSQLTRWLAPSVYADVAQHVAGLAQGRPRTRRVVRSVHVCEPADGVAEAAAVVVAPLRSRAVAVRLEGVDGRWRCTRLTVL